MAELPLWPLARASLLFMAAWAFLVWLASLWRRDASLIDRFWSLIVVQPVLLYAWLSPVHGPRGVAMGLLAALWAVRLGVYVTRRNWGHGEDRRYVAIRERNQPGYAGKSLYLVFGLQAVLAWIVAAPLWVGLRAGPGWGWLDVAGLALALAGVAIEWMADAQMARFRADPANASQVMDQGLWRYSRHPNYFGEACVWWGLWLMALSGAGLAGLAAIASPLLMTVLLLRVSGVALLEKDIAGRRPAYRAYVHRTNAFLPGRPREAP